MLKPNSSESIEKKDDNNATKSKEMLKFPLIIKKRGDSGDSLNSVSKREKVLKLL
jgi:hypothetical protein